MREMKTRLTIRLVAWLLGVGGLGLTALGGAPEAQIGASMSGLPVLKGSAYGQPPLYSPLTLLEAGPKCVHPYRRPQHDVGGR